MQRYVTTIMHSLHYDACQCHVQTTCMCKPEVSVRCHSDMRHQGPRCIRQMGFTEGMQTCTNTTRGAAHLGSSYKAASQV